MIKESKGDSMNYKEQLKAKQAERRQAAKDRQLDDYRQDPGYQQIYSEK